MGSSTHSLVWATCLSAARNSHGISGALFDRHERRGAERELLAAETHVAAAGGLDVLEPVRLAPEIQPDGYRVPGAEGAYRYVAQDADLRPTCSRSANAAWPAKRRVILLTAPRVNLVIARGNVIGGLSSWVARLMAQIQRLGGRSRPGGAMGLFRRGLTACALRCRTVRLDHVGTAAQGNRPSHKNCVIVKL